MTTGFYRFLKHFRNRFIVFATIATMLGSLLLINTPAFTAPTGVMQAQQPGPVSLGPLFETDLAELKPSDALKSLADKAKQKRSECPDAFTLQVVLRGVGDPIFLDTLAKAREESLETFLTSYGLKKGLDYNLLPFNVKGARDDVQASYQSPAQPKLKTTSVPPKGTKVKPGDTIKITMTAADDSNAAQSGIRAIQLVDQQSNGIVPDPWYADGKVSKCSAAARNPPPLTVTYKVPENPPPIVRLEASAEDFAGNVERDLGTFPTGDWHGTWKLHRKIVADGYEHTITWSFAVSEMPGGNQFSAEVRGRAAVQIVYTPESKYEECTFVHKISPKSSEMEVTGQRLSDRLIINFPDPNIIDTVRQVCVRGLDETESKPVEDVRGAIFHVSGIAPDAKYPLTARVPPINEQNRVTITMELHRAKK